MKVRIAYTTEVSDDYRRAINVFYGLPGLASRDEVKNWLLNYGSSQDDDLMHDLQEHERQVHDLIGELGSD